MSELPSRIGRFEIRRALGSGGMGIVYAARDDELQRDVAIKLLHADLHDRHQRRLQREAQAMARLTHPNVVAVYQVGQHRDQIYVAMELVAGQPLSRWQQVRRPPGETVAMYIQAARGLAAAHGAGLVHRDFKPDNALVGDDGRLRVLDFGLAAADGEGSRDAATLDGADDALSDDLTATGAVLGTPAYMAPEQFRGDPVTAAADQFSFFVALHEALHGVRPFEGDNRMLLATNVMDGRRRPWPEDSEVPPRIRAAIERGLSSDPAQRWPSMEDVIDALASDPTRRRRRRQVAALGIAAAAGLGAWTLATGTEEPAPCADGTTRIAKAWNETRADDIRSALAASGASFTATTAERVTKGLDDYAHAWAETYEDACAATRIRGEQSEARLDLRMACLQGRLRSLDALATVLRKADSDGARRAIAAVGELPAIDACDDEAHLEAAVPPPQDAAVAAEVDRVRDRVARARALTQAARIEPARREAEAAVEAAAATGYDPVLAEARLVLGVALEEAGEYESAASELEASFMLASGAGLVPVAVDAAIRLGFLHTSKLGREDEARRWAEHAAASIERLGNPARETVRLEWMLGVLDVRAHALSDALVHHERALAIAEDRVGDDDLLTAAVRMRVGSDLAALGRYDEALKKQQSAQAVRERILSAQHPTLGIGYSDIALTYKAAGRREEAIEHHRRSLAIMRAALGPDHPDVARAHSQLGAALGELARSDEAIEHLLEALRIETAVFGELHERVAITRNNVGAALGMAGRAREAAEHFRRSLEIHERGERDDPLGAANDRMNLGLALVEDGRGDEGLPHLLQALQVYQAQDDELPFLAPLQRNIGNVLGRLGRHDEAVPHYRESIEIARRRLGDDHIEVGLSLAAMGTTERELGRLTDAREHLRQGLSLLDDRAIPPLHLADYESTYGRVLAEAGDIPAARKPLERAMGRLRDAGANDKADEIEAFLREL